MTIGTKVLLKSFNGTTGTEPDCDPAEDYWKLIGSTGEIIQDPTEKGIYASFSRQKRVCVKFDVSVAEQGLICHNPVPNSLWINIDDLELFG